MLLVGDKPTIERSLRSLRETIGKYEAENGKVTVEMAQRLEPVP